MNQISLSFSIAHLHANTKITPSDVAQSSNIYLLNPLFVDIINALVVLECDFLVQFLVHYLI